MISIICLLGFAIVPFTVFVLTLISQHISKSTNPKTIKFPLGKKGWPIIGETLAFVLCPQKFILERMTTYLLMSSRGVDSIQHYVPIVHSMVQQHLDQCWAPFDQVKAFTLAKEFTFALSCIFSVPINLPGTPYYKAITGGKLVKERLAEIIKQRRKEMIETNKIAMMILNVEIYWVVWLWILSKMTIIQVMRILLAK
ncbi:hypothetical protein RDABS01_027758 [Bienertia sinuspersici]